MRTQSPQWGEIMIKIKISSLQQRLALFLLLPVALLLFAMIWMGFAFARDALLLQWREVSVLKLERAAHLIDMRLAHPKNWLQMYMYAAGVRSSAAMRQQLVERLHGMDGVERVNVTWLDEKLPPVPTQHGIRRDPSHQSTGMRRNSGKTHSRRSVPVEITSPRYDAVEDHATISLISDLAAEDGEILGKLEVTIRFDYLVEDIKSSKWWLAHKAFLVDQTGKVLMCAAPHEKRQLGDSGDAMELATLNALQQAPFGTLLGKGVPPNEVSVYFRLKEVPWTLVIIAPGREILAPLVRFRDYFFSSGLIFVIFILVLMRWVIGRTASSIRSVAAAAQNIARGTHSPFLPARTQDEVGQLIESFNTMAGQLEERIRLKEALDLAMEVQQSLLPREAPQIDGLDIAGKCIYCDETGGDYFDFMEFSELDGRIGVVVGDVAGHGIGAALIMATVRSLLRSRITQPGTLSQVITDVNRMLCLDTSKTMSFMTLFFMLADRLNRKINWVRAGHDPAIIYNTSTDSFSELRGTGIALGVDETLSFHEYEYTGWTDDQMIIIGTDGIWEATDDQGELFGKERLLELVRRHKDHSAQEIVQIIIDALGEFHRTASQQDDITLVVMKTRPL